MGAFAIGTMMCWTATALPDLRNSPTIGPITESQESVISSIVTLGAAAACPLTGYCVERFGRRKTMLALTIPFVSGWLLIAFAEHIYMIYAGRFVTGYCGGAFSLAAPIFIAETADVDIRGKLSAGFDLMITVGMLFM
ncbi:unnamed protein product [Allacma fusca]|uniref:Major facilitator superfamily (MFS) profile domain-containing protein n=1 Tax=Allacma fusca TaxID=39272 RepID=A0A8J2P0S2_9HEXA|nr:unnamed protein product [Allacma fusca]